MCVVGIAASGCGVATGRTAQEALDRVDPGQARVVDTRCGDTDSTRFVPGTTRALDVVVPVPDPTGTLVAPTRPR